MKTKIHPGKSQFLDWKKVKEPWSTWHNQNKRRNNNELNAVDLSSTNDNDNTSVDTDDSFELPGIDDKDMDTLLEANGENAKGKETWRSGQDERQVQAEICTIVNNASERNNKKNQRCISLKHINH